MLARGTLSAALLMAITTSLLVMTVQGGLRSPVRSKQPVYKDKELVEQMKNLHETGLLPDGTADDWHPLFSKVVRSRDARHEGHPQFNPRSPDRFAHTVPNDEWLVHLHPDVDAAQVAEDLGMTFDHFVANHDNLAVFTLRPVNGDHQERFVPSALPKDELKTITDSLSNHQGVVSFEQNRIKKMQTLASFVDPSYLDQWHLNNTGQGGNPASVTRDVGQDINVGPAWADGHTGDSVWILIVDDGLQADHPDIAPNYVGVDNANFAVSSTDSNRDDPTPTQGESHGTACGGLAAAADDGASCGVGVAYEADMAGIKLIGQPAFLSDFLTAYTEGTCEISSNSWGSTADVDDLLGPEVTSLQDQLDIGRGGLGRLYLWAAGNDGFTKDVALNGYGTMRGILLIAGSGTSGNVAEYSTEGAGIFCNCPTMDLYQETLDLTIPGDFTVRTKITTTDLDLTGTDGYIDGDCGATFSGTSAATPICAGVVALVIDANPALHWRDVHWILALSAEKNGATDGSWITNAAGLPWSRRHGFGRLNAAAAVTLADGWTNVGDNSEYDSGDLVSGSQAMPSAQNGGVESISGTWVHPTPASSEVIEEVVVTFAFTGFYFRKYQFEVTSPLNTTHVVLAAEITYRDDTQVGDSFLQSGRPMVVHGFRGEAPEGTWTWTIYDKDNQTLDDEGPVLTEVRINTYTVAAADVTVAKAPLQRETTCGNGIREFPEECDDAGASPYCDASCNLICVCGDGIVNVLCGETCDHGGTPTATCGDLDPAVNQDRLRTTGSPDGRCQARAANDDPEWATAMGSGTVSVPFDNSPGNNVTVSNVQADTGCGYAQGGYDVWFEWTAPSAGSVQFSTCNNATEAGILDSFLTVYDAPTGDVNDLVACNDDWVCENQYSSVTDCIEVEAGQSLWVRVAGWERESGTGQLDALFDTDAVCQYCKSWTADELAGFNTTSLASDFVGTVCPNRGVGNYLPTRGLGTAADSTLGTLETLQALKDEWKADSSTHETACVDAVLDFYCNTIVPECEQTGNDLSSISPTIAFPCYSACVGILTACPETGYDVVSEIYADAWFDCVVYFGFAISTPETSACVESECPRGEESCWDTDENIYGDSPLDAFLSDDIDCGWCDIPACPVECEGSCTVSNGVATCACSGIGCYSSVLIGVAVVAAAVGGAIIFYNQAEAKAEAEYDARKAAENNY